MDELEKVLSDALNADIGSAPLGPGLAHRVVAEAYRRIRWRHAVVVAIGLGFVIGCVVATTPAWVGTVIASFEKSGSCGWETDWKGDNLEIAYAGGVMDETDGQPALEMTFRLKDPSDTDGNRRWFFCAVPVAGEAWWRDTEALAFDIRCVGGSPRWTGPSLLDVDGNAYSTGIGWDGVCRRIGDGTWGEMSKTWTTYVMPYAALKGTANAPAFDPARVRALRFAGGAFDQKLRIRNLRLLPKRGVSLPPSAGNPFLDAPTKTIASFDLPGACGWRTVAVGTNLVIRYEGGVADDLDGKPVLKVDFSLKNPEDARGEARWFFSELPLAADATWERSRALSFDVRCGKGNPMWTYPTLVDSEGVTYGIRTGWSGIRLTDPHVGKGRMATVWTTYTMRFSDLKPDDKHPKAVFDPKKVVAIRLQGGAFDQTIYLRNLRLVLSE